MENYYLIIVILLFALAVSDLIVGVSNDAVNFLNSAFGSKAAPKWQIFTVAAIGIMVGTTFSSGMMEVARKGVFHPEMLSFSEIMVIFLAVMITDIILLDTFNTLGLPTSTTVSIVFELLGAAVAVSLVKIKLLGGSVADLALYINSGKALAIIFGILLSVVIAFSIGALVQFLARLFFTFRYESRMRFGGALFAGLAVSIIVYFLLIKGIDGSVLALLPVGSSGNLSAWVTSHTMTLLMGSFIISAVLLQILHWLFRTDILKVVVLSGTFALAMAFAGNDLVNFIGVPIAGYKSFLAWMEAGATDADLFTMEMLQGEVSTPFVFLLLSGLVMIVTLITSRKARLVTQTEINLSRQSEGDERFGSSMLARMVVRNSLNLNRNIQRLVPVRIQQYIQKRFNDQEGPSSHLDNGAAFDKVRASVNLMVASVLIAFGTSLKLPLSTTYVTFMVAMGTSLADRAWDRESAVYRVSGVAAVIGGWFITAIVAFTIAALIAWLISAGGMPVVFIFMLIALGLAARTHLIFRKRAKRSEEEEEFLVELDQTEKAAGKSKKQTLKTLLSANKIYSLAIDGFLRDDRQSLKEAIEMKNLLNHKTRKQKNKLLDTISRMIRDDIDAGHFYVQVVDYQREMAHALGNISEPLAEHLENQHKPFNAHQTDEIRDLLSDMDEFYNFALHIVKDSRFDGLNELIDKRVQITNRLQEIEKEQIRRIRNQEVNTRNSILFFNCLSETKTLLLHSIHLVKAHRDFIVVNSRTVS